MYEAFIWDAQDVSSSAMKSELYEQTNFLKLRLFWYLIMLV